jgi:hypothetical protein
MRIEIAVPAPKNQATNQETFLNLGCQILALYFPWKRRKELPPQKKLMNLMEQLQWLYATRCSNEFFSQEDCDLADELLTEMIVEHLPPPHSQQYFC